MVYETEDEYLYAPRVVSGHPTKKTITLRVYDGCDCCKRDGKKSIARGGMGPWTQRYCFECTENYAENAAYKDKLCNDLATSLATSDEKLLLMFMKSPMMTEQKAYEQLAGIRRWRDHVSVYENGKYIKIKDIIGEQ